METPKVMVVIEKTKHMIYLGFLFLLCLCGDVIGVDVGNSNQDYGININNPNIINYSTVYVNRSDYWDDLDTPADISLDEIGAPVLNVDFNSQDIDNAFDIEAENNLWVGNDITLVDMLEHEGDVDTYFHFAGDNWIEIVAGGVNYLNLFNNLLTIGVNTTINNDLTVTGTIYGDGSGITNSEFWYNHTSIVYDLWNAIWKTTFNQTYHDKAPMDYTNVAMRNTTNYFQDSQFIQKSLTGAGNILFKAWDTSGAGTGYFAVTEGGTGADIFYPTFNFRSSNAHTGGYLTATVDDDQDDTDRTAHAGLVVDSRRGGGVLQNLDLFKVSSYGNIKFTIEREGKVGIMTQNPTALIDIRDTIALSNLLLGGDGVVNSNVATIFSGSADQLSIGTDGTEAIRIDTNQNINCIGNITAENVMLQAIYIQASDLVDQEFATANIKQPINLTTTDEGNGISINGEYNVSISTTGIYSIFAQPQVSTGAGGAGKFHMWLEKHDTTQWLNVSNSNVELVLANNEENVIPLIVTMRLNANEKIRIMGSVSDTAIKLNYQDIFNEPDIPSIIFTMYRIGN